MDSEGLHEYYRDNFGSTRHLQGQKVNARTNLAALRRLLDLRQVHSWLDVGTGYGFLLQSLAQNYSIDVHGVELSSQEADYARKELGLPVHPIPLSESPVPRAHFDVVSAFEVIEHIPDPRAFVAELAEYVRPGGHLLIMTDNFESKPVSQLGARFPKWIPHTHVSHFSAATLRQCIQAVPGLTLEVESAYTPWDVMARMWLSFLQKPTPDEQAYDLKSALATEMQRKYKLYHLRRVLNPLWATLDLRKTLAGGALMYALCRRAN
jgi:2-polyprenyl-3-methyl-5-hydroxy-6-metoxy-1,4-benzoquinol methylase